MSTYAAYDCHPWDLNGWLTILQLPPNPSPEMIEEDARRRQYRSLSTRHSRMESAAELYKDVRAMLRDIKSKTLTLPINFNQAKWQILLRMFLSVIHIHLNHPWRAWRNAMGAYQLLEDIGERGCPLDQNPWAHMLNTTFILLGDLDKIAENKSICKGRRGTSPLESSESEIEEPDSDDEEEQTGSSQHPATDASTSQQ